MPSLQLTTMNDDDNKNGGDSAATNIASTAPSSSSPSSPSPSHRIDIDIPQAGSSSTTPRWSLLPADLIHVIAQHLDARSLSRLASVERTCHQTIKTHSNKLWLSLLNHTTWTVHWLDNIKLNQRMKMYENLRATQPRQYYMTRLRHSENLRSEVMLKRADIGKKQEGDTRIYYMSFYEEAILPVLVVGLVCTFFALLVYQLASRDGQVNFLSMWPIFTICFLIALSTCNLCFIKYRHRYTDSYRDRWLPDKYYDESASYIQWAMYSIGPKDYGEQAEPHATFCLMCISFVVFLILLILRCTHTIEWHWALIFIPLYIVILLVCCAGMGWANDDDDEGGGFSQIFFIGFLIVTGIPVLTFIILLLLYLIGISSVSSLTYVFIPLYFIDFLSIFVAFSIITDNDEGVLFPVACWLLTSGSLIVWRVLLGLKVDGTIDISYALVFLPIFVSLAVLLVTLLIVVTVNTRDSKQVRKEKLKRQYDDIGKKLELPV